MKRRIASVKMNTIRLCFYYFISFYSEKSANTPCFLAYKHCPPSCFHSQTFFL